MIGERERATNKSNSPAAFAPTSKADTGAGLGLAPRVPEIGTAVAGAPRVTPPGHRFDEIAVFPAGTALQENQKPLAPSAQPQDKAGAPAESGPIPDKQAAPANANEIQAIELIEPDKIILTFTNKKHKVLNTTYNGTPAPGDYICAFVDGKFSCTISSGQVNANGNVVEWDMPADVNLEGIKTFPFTVTEYGIVIFAEATEPDRADTFPFGISAKIQGETKSKSPSEGPAAETAPESKTKQGKRKKESARSKTRGKKTKDTAEGKGKEPDGKPESSQETNQTQTESPTTTPSTAKPTAGYDEVKKELDALPPEVKELVGGETLKPEDYPTILEILAVLKTLSPNEIALYKFIARGTTDDLALLLKSIQIFKELFSALEKPDFTQPPPPPSKSLDEKVAEILKRVNAKDFAKLSSEDKIAIARTLSAEITDAQLSNMKAHPFDTTVDLLKGMVDLNAISAAAVSDLEQVFAEDKSTPSRLAHFAGFVNKSSNLTMAAATLFVVVQFIPGVDLAVDLVAFGSLMAGALATALLSTAMEQELHIRAAGDAKTVEDFDEEAVKAASAETNLVVILGMMVVGGLLKAGAPKLKALLGLEKPKATGAGVPKPNASEEAVTEHNAQVGPVTEANTPTAAVPEANPPEAAVAEANAPVTAVPEPNTPVAAVPEPTPTQAVSATEAFDAKLAAAKPKPIPELKGVLKEINKLYQKQGKATAAEKQVVREYWKKLLRSPEDAAKIPDADFRKLLWFLTLPDAPPPPPSAFATFSSKAEVSAAAEEALTKAPNQTKAASLEEAQTKKPDLTGPSGTLTGKEIVAALKADPPSATKTSVLRMIREIFKTQEDPHAYSEMVGEIWERAKKIAETQSKRIEETGRSAFTLAMIDMLIDKGVPLEILTEPLESEPFNKIVLDPGAAVVDLAFKNGPHGISPHMLEYLVLDDMLHRLTPPSSMKEFLIDLSKLDEPGLAGDIWNLLLDASPESMRSPEFFMSVLRQLIPELE